MNIHRLMRRCGWKIMTAFIFCLSNIAVAEISPPAGTTSGQLLQNNPMLNAPSAPHSDGLSEYPKNKINESGGKDTSENTGPKIKVKQIVVSDAPESARKDVEAFVAKYHDNRLSLAQLKMIAAEITSILQYHGQRLSYAYIPVQKVTNDTIKIKVFTGHLEAITLHENKSLVKDSILKKYLSKIFDARQDVTQTETDLLAISDLPGILNVSPFLTAGQESGGSILNLDLTPSPRVEGVVVFDNAGSITSGRDRIGTQVTVNSPFGIGDRFQGLAYISPDFLQTNHDSKHGNTFISRLSYDALVGANSTRLGLSYSRVNYKLGGPVLSGLGDGFAEIMSLYGSRSLIRSNNSNLTLGINADFKRMSDKFWGDDNRRTAGLLTFMLSGYRSASLAGLPNVIQYQLGFSGGRLNNSDAWNGLQTKGDFFKSNLNINYQQGLLPGIAFTILINAQQASKNLDGAEKISLGGPYAVRAYGNSTSSADNAWIASPGFSLAVPGVNGLTTDIFYDYAKGKIQKFSRQASRVTLRGYGVGLNYDLNSKMFINASYAWRDGHDKLLPSQNKAMGWITAGIRF